MLSSFMLLSFSDVSVWLSLSLRVMCRVVDGVFAVVVDVAVVIVVSDLLVGLSLFLRGTCRVVDVVCGCHC